ncbi:MAG TPA: hypothetical protein VFQ91_09570 [Bryobacteraceae bacterium]|nr:hypothetical protein [Bryobacteraceae bacterium]
MEFSEEILQAALEGLLLKRGRIEAQMETVKSLLGNKAAKARSAAALDGIQDGVLTLTPKPRVKRVISPEARQRIIDAQKRRWALHRGEVPAKNVS